MADSTTVEISDNFAESEANKSKISMRTVEFGKTGRKVSAIGLGGAQFIYDSAAEKDVIVDLIQYAYGVGINYFDTAPVYQSEATFGLALQNFDRSSYFLATKIGRYPEADILKRHDLSAKHTEESIENSLKLLRTPYLDLCQIHDFDYAENAVETILSETLPCMDKLRQKGVIKHIGLASFDLEAMKQIVERSPIKVDSVLTHTRLTMVDQSFAGYIPFFKERGVATINAAPLAMGLLSSNPIPVWMNIDDRLRATSRKVVTSCQLSKYVIERLANAYSYLEGERLGVDVTLTGAATRKLLDLNLKAYFEGVSKAERTMMRQIVEDYSALPPEIRDVNRIYNAAHFKEIAAARQAAQKAE